MCLSPVSTKLFETSRMHGITTGFARKGEWHPVIHFGYAQAEALRIDCDGFLWYSWWDLWGWGRLVPPEDDDEGVEIPRSTIQPSELQLTELTEAIDPLGDSDDYGISIYVRTVQYLESIN